MKHTYQYKFTFKRDGEILFETYYGYRHLRSILKNGIALPPANYIDALIKRRQAEGYELMKYCKKLHSMLPQYYIMDNKGCLLDCVTKFNDLPDALANVLKDIPELYQNYSDFEHWCSSLQASWEEITVGLLNHEAWCDDIAKYVQVEYE